MQENERLISLDAFRGFTIASMIMVNNPGSWSNVYAPLLHRPWNGITPTDLIFPFFIFIVGVSIALAYTKRLEAGLPKKEMYIKILWRAVKIFAVGVLLALYSKINNSDLGNTYFLWLILIIVLMGILVLPEFRIKSRIYSNALWLLNILAIGTILTLIIFKFNDLRIVGVLQRIALVFLVCAILFLTTKWKIQAIIAGVILVGYWIVMTLVPTPGYDTPMLLPGANMAAWIDTYLVPGKLYQKTWDPEGFFSTFPAIASGITGMLAGTLLVSKKSMEQKIIWLFTAGFILATAGVAWSWCFSLNKALWTSSFVLATSGLACLTLAISLYLVDVLGYKKYAKPWVIFGSNAIGVYVLAGLLGYLFYGGHFGGKSLKGLFMDLFTGIGMEPKLVSLIAALLYIGILFIPALILYRKKIFIKL
jgi:predicted acyltransferase